MGASVKLVKGKKSLTYCTYSDTESSEESIENRKKAFTSSTTPRMLIDSENATMITSDLAEDINSGENGAFEENDAYTEDDTDAAFEENDSNSDDVSSTSSSEEAILKCDGIIISQPLVAESNCSSADSEPRYNAIRYTVKEDGYYYVVFSSGDEKVVNIY